MNEPTLYDGFRIEVRGGTIQLEGSPPLHVGAEPRTIGRGEGCDLVVSNDKQVSKIHLEVVGTEHGLRLRDTGSRNGSFLGGCRFEGVYVTQPVEVRCGKTTTLTITPTEPERIRVSAAEDFGPLVGSTARMRALFTRLRRLAQTDLSVLIIGETGTGKELVANAIHAASKRKDRPFVIVDCASIQPTLAESTLFGHEKGAFTGATSRRMSPFEDADGGTLFLDEVGELPPEVQKNLLRVLAEGRVKRLGANQYESVNVRVIAATWRDLGEGVNSGAFRSDLYFRLRHEQIDVPPLRERTEDIPLLVQRILKERSASNAFKRIPQLAFERLKHHPWPGNARELRIAVLRALAYDDGEGPLELEVIQEPRARDKKAPSFGGTVRDAIGTVEAAYYTHLYSETKGNVSAMARRAGADRKTVLQKLRDYQIGHGRDPA